MNFFPQIHCTPDATLTNSSFKTALDLSCEFGRSRVVDLLLQSDLCDTILHENNDHHNLLNKEKSSCLHLAAKNGHIDVIRLLLGMQWLSVRALQWLSVRAFQWYAI